ncbi:cache domain-containing protein [Aurantimonas sp. A2-1-M11]|uniref:cache domain-containing protein n=1 Tax=Aurantimonas sp. A2-1-M11 TaxID=3113712 RepID=UPI002F93129B
MWSFRTVLTSALVALQVAALLAILALTYFASQNVLLSYAEQLTQRVADDTTTFTQNFLTPADDAAALSQRLAESPVLGTSDRPALERYFYEILRSRSDFAGIFYGAADGAFLYVSRDRSVEGAEYRIKRVATQPDRSVELIYLTADFRPVSRRRDDADTYDPRTRPWYVKASTTRDVVWTDPYIFFSAQRPGITVAKAVRADERLGMRGAVGIDIEIHALSAFLDGLKIGSRGSAAIVSQSGEVIAHRDPSLVLATDVSGKQRFAQVWEIDDPALAQAVSSLPGGLASVNPGETRLTRFEAGGENWRGAVKRLAGSRTPWAVVTYLPESDILGPIYSIRDIGIAVVAIVVALTALLGVLLARALTRPIGALAAQAERISEGNFADIPLPTMWTKELAGTRQAMRRATSWLRDYRRENETLAERLREAGRVLERRVEERTEELAVANRDLEQANDNAELLAHELDHRVKNLFAITASLVTLAAKHATTPLEVADEARGRINALARAHADTQSARESQLAGIVTSVLRPYAGIAEVQLTIEGDPVTIPSSSVTPLGLILYELATNAAKYGALRGTGGALDVRWTAAGNGGVRMVWTETPAESPAGDVINPSQHSGFGSVMLDAMASRLNANIQRQLTPRGLRVVLTMEALEERGGLRTVAAAEA